MRVQVLAAMIVAALLGTNAFAEANSKSDVAGAYKKAQQLNNASNFTEVFFGNGAAELTSDAKRQLDDLMARTAATGKIDSIKIIAWADKEYPAADDKALDNNARKLADERALEVRGYFEDRNLKLKTDVYNMAEKPNALDELLKTSDVKVKRNLELAGLAHPDQSKMPAKAGRALVMVITK